MATVQERASTGTIGDKPADPYKAKNYDTGAPVKEKMEALLAFIDRCRYGMMTTRDTNTGRLASRCMELAAKVRPTQSLSLPLHFPKELESAKKTARNPTARTFSSSQTCTPTRSTSWSRTRT